MPVLHRKYRLGWLTLKRHGVGGEETQRDIETRTHDFGSDRPPPSLGHAGSWCELRLQDGDGGSVRARGTRPMPINAFALVAGGPCDDLATCVGGAW